MAKRRKRGGRKKTVNDLRRHATRRLFERYGIEMTKDEYWELCQDIRKCNNLQNKYDYKKDTHSRSFITVVIEGQEMRAVWNTNLRAIATFLAPYMKYL